MTSTMSTTRKPLFYNKKWWFFACSVCFVVGEKECRGGTTMEKIDDFVLGTVDKVHNVFYPVH